MNAPSVVSMSTEQGVAEGALPAITPHDLNRAFVQAGVARFAREHQQVALVDLLPSEAEFYTDLNCAPGNWTQCCKSLAALAPGLPGPWGQVLRDHRLQLHEWFATALAGECEAQHGLALALGALQGESGVARVSLHLLEALTAHLFDAPFSPLHWPNHRLLRQGLLDLEGEGPLPSRSLAMSPRCWALLCGDGRPWPETRALSLEDDIVLPEKLVETLTEIATSLQRTSSVLVVRAPHAAGLAVAARLAALLEKQPVAVSRTDWERGLRLATACRYGRWLPVMQLELGPGERHLFDAEALALTPIVVLTGQDGSVEAAEVTEVRVPSLTRAERQRAWRAALSAGSDAGLTDQALIDGSSIHVLARRMRFDAARQPGATPAELLREARASHGGERLRALAQSVPERVAEDALVLPAALSRQFEQLQRRCQLRESIWQGLGASLAHASPGVRALFAGDSGTGKTLAACRLSTVLGMPLYRVDLAAVLNKYVGETEKNLGRLLDEAAALDVMLLVDEADALFGRRGEGRETGERYANMMTNYLLTRIDTHPGIIVLTTNARGRLDSAFSRRFDAVIEFSAPGLEERYRLWRSHLGGRAPDERSLRLLASYSDLAGGHIRNAVLHAVAQSPLDPARPVALALLVAGLIEEYRKLGRGAPPQLAHIGA